MIILLLFMFISFFLIRRLNVVLSSESDDYFFQRETLKDVDNTEIKTVNNTDEEYTSKLNNSAILCLEEIKNKMQNFNLEAFINITKKIISILIDDLNSKEDSRILDLLTESFQLEYKQIRSDFQGELFLISIDKIEIIEIKKISEFYIINVRIDMIQKVQENEKVINVQTRENWEFINNGNYKWLLNKISNEDQDN